MCDKIVNGEKGERGNNQARLRHEFMNEELESTMTGNATNPNERIRLDVRNGIYIYTYDIERENSK